MSWLYTKLFSSSNNEKSPNVDIIKDSEVSPERLSKHLITTNQLIPAIQYLNIDIIIGELADIKKKGLLPQGCLYQIQRSRFNDKIYVYFMHSSLTSMRENALTFEWMRKHSPLLHKYADDKGIIKGKSIEWQIEVVNHYDPSEN